MTSGYDADYCRLLENGICFRFLGMGGGDPGSTEAEAFHEALRQRAEADGFQVETFFGQTSPGSAFLEPGVMLLRPSGDKYEWQHQHRWIENDEWRGKLLPLLASDWGAQLTDARRRASARALD